MIKNIEINKRLLRSLYDFCKENNIILKEYIEETLSNRLNLDKYGDLNLLKKNKNNIHIDDLFLDIEKKCISLRLLDESSNDVIKLTIDLEQFDNFKEAIKLWNYEDDEKKSCIINNNSVSEIKKNNIVKRKLKIN